MEDEVDDKRNQSRITTQNQVFPIMSSNENNHTVPKSLFPSAVSFPRTGDKTFAGNFKGNLNYHMFWRPMISTK